MLGEGPSLQPLGLTGTLPNPYLELHHLQDGIDTIFAFNDQWQQIDGSSTGLENKLVESHFRPPPGAPEQYLDESALWPTLQPGTYTVFLRDSGGDSGIGLIELYEY